MKTQREGYREFDWDFAITLNNPIRLNYYKHYWDKKVTEEEFVKAIKQIKPFSRNASLTGETRRVKYHNRYSPSRIRCQYKRLKKIYGFFIGENKVNFLEI